MKVAFTSGSLTPRCLHQTEGSVFKRESNGSLVQRGAPTNANETMKGGTINLRRNCDRERKQECKCSRRWKKHIPCERSTNIVQKIAGTCSNGGSFHMASK